MIGRKNDFIGDNDLYFVKITGLKLGETAHMEVKKKVGLSEDGSMILEELDDTKEISGELIRVSTRSYDHKGDTVRLIELWLKDHQAGEVYKVQVGTNSAMRTIINCLAGVESFGIIEIRVDNEKDENGKKTGYPSTFVSNNDVPLKWTWKYNDPEWQEKIDVTETSIKGKKVKQRDMYRLDNWLIDEVLMGRIATKLNNRGAQTAKNEVAVHEHADVIDSDDPDVLPF